MRVRTFLWLSVGIAGGCQGPDDRNGTLSRTIARPPGMVGEVAADVLLELGFQIQSDVHREKGGEIEAREPPPGRREVVLRFEEVQPGRTLVRIDPGRFDHAFGEQVLDRIAVRVGHESERAPPYIRATLQGRFEATLDQALAALHAALDQQGASVLNQVVQTLGARVEAYSSDDTEYEIAIVVRDSGPLDVQFTASCDSQEKAERRAEQVKKGFAQALVSLR
jgi:hypothetical protein